MFDFMRDFQAKKGVKLGSVAIFHEDTLWGADSGKVQKEMADTLGYT